MLFPWSKKTVFSALEIGASKDPIIRERFKSWKIRKYLQGADLEYSRAYADREFMTDLDRQLSIITFLRFLEEGQISDVAETIKRFAKNGIGYDNLPDSYSFRRGASLDFFPLDIIDSVIVGDTDMQMIGSRYRQAAKDYLGMNLSCFGDLPEKMYGDFGTKTDEVIQCVADFNRRLEEYLTTDPADPEEFERRSEILYKMGAPLYSPINSPLHNLASVISHASSGCNFPSRCIAIMQDVKVGFYKDLLTREDDANKEEFGFCLKSSGFPYAIVTPDDMDKIPGMNIPYVSRKETAELKKDLIETLSGADV